MYGRHYGYEMTHEKLSDLEVTPNPELVVCRNLADGHPLSSVSDNLLPHAWKRM